MENKEAKGYGFSLYIFQRDHFPNFRQTIIAWQ